MAAVWPRGLPSVVAVVAAPLLLRWSRPWLASIGADRTGPAAALAWTAALYGVAAVVVLPVGPRAG
ncbi:hypothetical protein GCM10027290_23900 [Micromonospora sonneratiae]